MKLFAIKTLKRKCFESFTHLKLIYVQKMSSGADWIQIDEFKILRHIIYSWLCFEPQIHDTEEKEILQASFCVFSDPWFVILAKKA